MKMRRRAIDGHPPRSSEDQDTCQACTKFGLTHRMLRLLNEIGAVADCADGVLDNSLYSFNVICVPKADGFRAYRVWHTFTQPPCDNDRLATGS